ncbi:hypothetical protein SAMN06296273_0655 [Nitrosomonas ureae]|uniref:Uncharacterized protein n=1 Tax=Nitrosomonas ureae TaxID=44577 RepID=A0A285BVA4_9PROT|nr:hypothetical protein SAMN06296273_0655 [Nitrosomonas ureae]
MQSRDATHRKIQWANMLSPGPKVKSKIKPMIVSSDHFLNMYDTAQTTISIVTIVAVVRVIPASVIKTLCYGVISLQYCLSC